MPDLQPDRRGSSEALDYGTLADLRYQIRRFLRGRETDARAAGIAPQQYLLLLQIKGLEAGRAATIGTLAERLQIHHNSAVGLVDRLARHGLVRRRRGAADRRRVVVELRPAGERILRALALSSLAELHSDGPALIDVLRRLVGSGTPHNGHADHRTWRP